MTQNFLTFCGEIFQLLTQNFQTFVLKVFQFFIQNFLIFNKNIFILWRKIFKLLIQSFCLIEFLTFKVNVKDQKQPRENSSKFSWHDENLIINPLYRSQLWFFSLTAQFSLTRFQPTQMHTFILFFLDFSSHLLHFLFPQNKKRK